MTFSERLEILKFIFPHSSLKFTPPPLKYALVAPLKTKILTRILMLLVCLSLGVIFITFDFYWNQAQINQIFIFRENDKHGKYLKFQHF